MTDSYPFARAQSSPGHEAAPADIDAQNHTLPLRLRQGSGTVVVMRAFRRIESMNGWIGA